MRNGLIVWDIEEIIMFINRNKKPTKTFLYYFYNFFFYFLFASALSEVTIIFFVFLWTINWILIFGM